MLSQGRAEEAKVTLRKIAKVNKVDISEEDLDSLEVVTEKGKTYTVIDLLRGWKMARISLNVWFNWYVAYYFQACFIIYFTIVGLI